MHKNAVWDFFSKKTVYFVVNKTKERLMGRT